MESGRRGGGEMKRGGEGSLNNHGDFNATNSITYLDYAC